LVQSSVGDRRKEGPYPDNPHRIWIIWNRRNAIVFRGERKTAQALLAEIKDVAQQWSMAGCKALNSLMVVDVVSK